MEADDSHLDLLSIFHYVMAGFVALGASVPVVHLLIGIKMVTDPSFFTGGRGAPPPFNPGWVFIGVAVAIILIGWCFAFALVFAGISLKRRRRYWYCFIMACLVCLNVPMGTALGVFSLVVLSRPSVKRIFGLE